MLHVNATQTGLLLWGIMAHLFCDWFLQNDGMARHKHQWTHPAAILHALHHAAGAFLVFGGGGAASVMFVTHLWIDTRKPLAGWGALIGQTDWVRPQERVVLHVQLWRDQAAHFLVLAVLAYFLGR